MKKEEVRDTASKQTPKIFSLSFGIYQKLGKIRNYQEGHPGGHKTPGHA